MVTIEELSGQIENCIFYIVEFTSDMTEYYSIFVIIIPISYYEQIIIHSPYLIISRM